MTVLLGLFALVLCKLGRNSLVSRAEIQGARQAAHQVFGLLEEQLAGKAHEDVQGIGKKDAQSSPRSPRSLRPHSSCNSGGPGISYPRPCASGVSSESRSTRKGFAALCSAVAGPFSPSDTPFVSNAFRTCRSKHQPTPGYVGTPCKELEPLLLCPLPKILNHGLDFRVGFVFQLVAPQDRHYYSLAGQVELLLGRDLFPYFVIQ